MRQSGRGALEGGRHCCGKQRKGKREEGRECNWQVKERRGRHKVSRRGGREIEECSGLNERLQGWKVRGVAHGEGNDKFRSSLGCSVQLEDTRERKKGWGGEWHRISTGHRGGVNSRFFKRRSTI